jgi:plastocyanin
LSDARDGRILGPVRILTTAIVIAAAAGGLAACGSDSGSGSGTPVEITAANTAFTPTDVKVPAGKTLSFTIKNSDGFEHNLTITDLGVNKDVEGNKSATASATAKAGTYQFFCSYHPKKMTGTITAS